MARALRKARYKTEVNRIIFGLPVNPATHVRKTEKVSVLDYIPNWTWICTFLWVDVHKRARAEVTTMWICADLLLSTGQKSRFSEVHNVCTAFVSASRKNPVG